MVGSPDSYPNATSCAPVRPAEFHQQAGLPPAAHLPGTGAGRLVASRAPVSKARSHDIWQPQQPRRRARRRRACRPRRRRLRAAPTPAGIPGDEPGAEVLEQRHEVRTARTTGNRRHSPVSRPQSTGEADLAGPSARRGGATDRGDVARRMARSARLPSWPESNRPGYRSAGLSRCRHRALTTLCYLRPRYGYGPQRRASGPGRPSQEWPLSTRYRHPYSRSTTSLIAA